MNNNDEIHLNDLGWKSKEWKKSLKFSQVFE
jgi:hypothetical protein